MSANKLDLLIYGATGFTGQKVIYELARGRKQYKNLTWGIAGRSFDKLKTVLQVVADKTGKDLSKVEIHVAALEIEDDIALVFSKTRVVINCCGPYSLYGEEVVRAAITARAHYVDVSGEPFFLESMQLRYSEEARAAGVFVVSACGFDSIPNDMGVVFLQQNFGGTLNSVESYMRTSLAPGYLLQAFRSGCINYGTWASLIHSLDNYELLRATRKQLYAERLPDFQPVPPKRMAPHRYEGAWYLPFPGADASVVHRTQRALHSRRGLRPAHFRAYFKMPNLLAILLLAMVVPVLWFMARFATTRKLLLDHPALFSFGLVTKTGPKQEILDNSSFELRLRGRGWRPGSDLNAEPDLALGARVHGLDPGYGFTALALVQAAATVLRERDRLPAPGVMTTGAAFRDTNLIANLQENGVTFEIIQDE